MSEALPLLYTLSDQGAPVPVPNEHMGRWAIWMGQHQGERELARSVVGRFIVATLFIGLAANHDPDGAPYLWETLVLSAEDVPEGFAATRYTTRTAAIHGHEDTVKRLVRRGLR